MTDPNLASSNEGNKKQKNTIILLLVLALAGSWGYFLWDSNKKSDTIVQQNGRIIQQDTEKAVIQQEFDQALVRLDSVKASNTELESKLAVRKKEIEENKVAIRKILNDRNATKEQLNTARNMVSELNDRIAGLEAEVSRLAGENKVLVQENTSLQVEKVALEGNLQRKQSENETLSRKVDVGSTFSASSFQIASVDIKKSGKERTTTTAKKVDKLLLSFDIENRIANSGPADIYLVVTGPDGKIVGHSSGNILLTREDGERLFTERVTVSYEKGTRQRIEFPIKGQDFQKGNYRVEVYHNGFRIGQAVRPLK